MFKGYSKTKTFLIGCGIPFLFFVLFNVLKLLGLDWDFIFKAVAVGFLFLSFPWSIPSFVLPRNISWLLDSSLAGYIEAISLIIGFGINFLIFLKLGIRYWLISVLKFVILIMMLAIFFTIWMIASENYIRL